MKRHYLTLFACMALMGAPGTIAAGVAARVSAIAAYILPKVEPEKENPLAV